MTYDEFRDAFRDKYNALYHFATTYIDFNEVEDRLEAAHAEWENGTSWIFDPMEFFMVCSNEPKNAPEIMTKKNSQSVCCIMLATFARMRLLLGQSI